jgi:hypothetical protein
MQIPWSAGLVLVAAGVVWMVFGGLWRDFTEVLSTSLLGGLVALLFLPALEINPAWVVVGICLILGMATVLFRRVALVVLTAAVFGASLCLMANMLAGWPTVPFQVFSLSRPEVCVQVRLPDVLGSQLLMSLLFGGMLLGVIVAFLSIDWARRIVMAVEGALAFLAGAVLLSIEFFSAQPVAGYPMKYAQVVVVVWIELAVISVLMQRLAERGRKSVGDTSALRENEP